LIVAATFSAQKVSSTPRQHEVQNHPLPVSLMVHRSVSMIDTTIARWPTSRRIPRSQATQKGGLRVPISAVSSEPGPLQHAIVNQQVPGSSPGLRTSSSAGGRWCRMRTRWNPDRRGTVAGPNKHDLAAETNAFRTPKKIRVGRIRVPTPARLTVLGQRHNVHP
jgi:hypothetical protein